MKEGVALRQGRKSKEVQKRPIIVFNVCFTKIRSEHSNNTLLSLLRIFMKQTLPDKFTYQIYQMVKENYATEKYS